MPDSFIERFRSVLLTLFIENGMFHPFVDGVYVQDGKEKESNTITRSPITVSYLSPQRPTLELNSIPIASSGESSVIPTDTNIPTLASQANLPHQTRARQSLASLLSLLLSNCFHNKSLASLLSQQISGILAFTRTFPVAAVTQPSTHHTHFFSQLWT